MGRVKNVSPSLTRTGRRYPWRHVEDAKFFSLILNPSGKEAAKLGSTREEKMKSLGIMVDRMMDRYAEGFNKEGVKTHQDLLYFYTIHEYRENDDGTVRPGIHVHIIVSRKDKTGKYKLSPMTNHRSGSSGVIKSGFNRDSFYRDCERIFDTSFGYQRRISESYDYHNTMKHGSNEERAAMIQASVQEEQIRQQVTAALARRAARLAQEAATEEAKHKLNWPVRTRRRRRETNSGTATTAITGRPLTS